MIILVLVFVLAALSLNMIQLAYTQSEIEPIEMINGGLEFKLQCPQTQVNIGNH